jgi:hypothetical protein
VKLEPRKAAWTRFNDRLTQMEGTSGPEFAAAIAPGGVLRSWIVQHLADETGESEETVEAAVDRWLENRESNTVFDPDRETLGLGDRIDMLIEKRRQFDEAEEAVEIAFVDSEIEAALADVGRPMDALGRFMAVREVFQDYGHDLDAGVYEMEMAMVATNLGWHDDARRSYERARPVAAMIRHGR